jgi:chromatin segregation and condensation protein Rec8/ScpA/Scc1 (kleisin family)
LWAILILFKMGEVEMSQEEDVEKKYNFHLYEKGKYF